MIGMRIKMYRSPADGSGYFGYSGGEGGPQWPENYLSFKQMYSLRDFLADLDPHMPDDFFTLMAIVNNKKLALATKYGKLTARLESDVSPFDASLWSRGLAGLYKFSKLLGSTRFQDIREFTRWANLNDSELKGCEKQEAIRLIEDFRTFLVAYNGKEVLGPESYEGEMTELANKVTKYYAIDLNVLLDALGKIKYYLNTGDKDFLDVDHVDVWGKRVTYEQMKSIDEIMERNFGENKHVFADVIEQKLFELSEKATESEEKADIKKYRSLESTASGFFYVYKAFLAAKSNAKHLLQDDDYAIKLFERLSSLVMISVERELDSLMLSTAFLNADGGAFDINVSDLKRVMKQEIEDGTNREKISAMFNEFEQLFTQEDSVASLGALFLPKLEGRNVMKVQAEAIASEVNNALDIGRRQGH